MSSPDVSNNELKASGREHQEQIFSAIAKNVRAFQYGDAALSGFNFPRSSVSAAAFGEAAVSSASTETLQAALIAHQQMGNSARATLGDFRQCS